jgi:DNA-binding response OmpR family regulator
MPEKKLLLVDIDTNHLQSLAALFAPYHFEVMTATDGLSAYEQYKKARPDLVILEAILPKLHGFDLTSRIHRESRGAVPVVIVTGLYRGPQYRREALTTFGAAEYFEKPYDPEKLVRAVLGLLREQSEIGLDLPNPEAVLGFLEARLKKAELTEPRKS